MSKDLKDWENLEEKDIEALFKKLNIPVYVDSFFVNFRTYSVTNEPTKEFLNIEIEVRNLNNNLTLKNHIDIATELGIIDFNNVEITTILKIWK